MLSFQAGNTQPLGEWVIKQMCYGLCIPYANSLAKLVPFKGWCQKHLRENPDAFRGDDIVAKCMDCCRAWAVGQFGADPEWDPRTGQPPDPAGEEGRRQRDICCEWCWNPEGPLANAG